MGVEGRWAGFQEVRKKCGEVGGCGTEKKGVDREWWGGVQLEIMTCAAEVSDSSLPPPEPPDQKGTRPAADWEHVKRQVRGVQTACAIERVRLAETAGEKVKTAE
jgi:hypothetical protein